MVTEKEVEKIEKKGAVEPRFISLCSDTTFKYLYKNNKTRSWIDYIIKEKFNVALSKFKLVDNELNTGNRIKDYRLDLKLENDACVYIIEMNNSYYKFLENKNYQYLYRIAGSRYDTGERYTSEPTKLILFNNFTNRKDPTNKTGNFRFMDPITNIVIDDIESFEIYLPNFEKTCYDNNEVDVSLSLFNAKSYEEMRKLTNNSKDLEIVKELERLAMNEDFIYEYDEEAVRKKTENSIRSEGFEDGMMQGITQGITQGIEQNKLKIAENMLKDNLPLSSILKYTGLSKKEIDALKKGNRTLVN